MRVAPLVAGAIQVSEDGRRLSAGVDAASGLATEVVRALDAAGVLVDNIEVRQPSLDDVFFSLTGGHVEEDEDGGGLPRREPPGAGRDAYMTATSLPSATLSCAAGLDRKTECQVR